MRNGRKVFLDHEQTVEFLIDIDRSKMIVHKIVVAHGAAEACRAFSDANVYGSLAVAYGQPGGDFSWPFLVEIDKNQPFHLLDSHNLPIILGELDTIFDLSSYLDAKLEAIRRYDGLVYCGEEDLLAHYFLNYDKATNRHFIGTPNSGYNGIFIGEGEWKDFIETPPYKRKKAADVPSYMWDQIIQKTAQNALNGTLLGNSTLLRGQSNGERAALLASCTIDCDDQCDKPILREFGTLGPKCFFHAVLLQGQGVRFPAAKSYQYR